MLVVNGSASVLQVSQDVVSCCAMCRALSDKDRKWVAAIAAKLGECLQ